MNLDAAYDNVSLLDILDRIIDKGVVLYGDIVISLGDVDLIAIKLALVLASVDRLEVGEWNNSEDF
ncbi:MAG: gas vesicle protein [Desulforudis sp.]|nr:MAG: gas vesicle protein [Desulforudis sp.]